MNQLRGKVAIITGGAQGIGRGITRHFLNIGMGVVIADLDAEAGRECVDDYRRLGDIRFIETDVGDESSVSRCIHETYRAHGTIHVLINNAGLADPDNGPVENLKLDRWNRVIATNLTGCFLTVKHAAPHLRQVRGAVVNIASTRALQSEPHCEAYAASKGGIVALTHALAVSLGDEIRVNCISPGWIQVGQWKKSRDRREPQLTPADHGQHPAGRVGKPEDVAALAAFLVSAEAAFITGQNFIVDGGMTRRMIYRDD